MPAELTTAPRRYRATDLPIGTRVLAGVHQELGTVAWARMAAPGYRFVEAVSVTLDTVRDAGEGALPYVGTVFPASAIEIEITREEGTRANTECERSRRMAAHGKEVHDCYTCLHSPHFPGQAGCGALIFGDEGDPTHDAICTFCCDSGTNDNDGWPPYWNLLNCGAWEGRPDRTRPGDCRQRMTTET